MKCISIQPIVYSEIQTVHQLFLASVPKTNTTLPNYTIKRIYTLYCNNLSWAINWVSRKMMSIFNVTMLFQVLLNSLPQPRLIAINTVAAKTKFP